MIRHAVFFRHWWLFLLTLCGIFAVTAAQAVTTTFNFSLTGSCTTSAGVYNSAGALVRTLWRGVPYNAGSYQKTWDGNNDFGVAQPADTYTVKIIHHNVNYVWDGVIGNTSNSYTDNIFRSCTSPGMLDMAIVGTSAIYVSGYDENGTEIKGFSTTDIRSSYELQQRSYGSNMSHIATDGTWYYVADIGGGYSNYTHSTFVAAYNVSDHSQATFLLNGNNNGQTLDLFALNNFNRASDTPADMDVYNSCVDVYINQPAYVPASGLAVQTTGNVLAISHGTLNQINCIDKRTGVTMPAMSVANPGRIAFAPNGDLWVITGTSVVRYINVGTAGYSIATTITGLANQLAVAVNPTTSNVYIADGGTSQQIKCFSSTGSPVTSFGNNGVFGVAGGYATDSTVVFPTSATAAKFNFVQSIDDVTPTTWLIVLADGTF